MLTFSSLKCLGLDNAVTAKEVSVQVWTLQVLLLDADLTHASKLSRYLKSPVATEVILVDAACVKGLSSAYFAVSATALPII